MRAANANGGLPIPGKVPQVGGQVANVVDPAAAPAVAKVPGVAGKILQDGAAPPVAANPADPAQRADQPQPPDPAHRTELFKNPFEVINVEIKADFTKIITQKLSDEVHVTGVPGQMVLEGGKVLDIIIQTRGQSSLDYDGGIPEPKLQFELKDPTQAVGTIFEHNHSVEIGTQGGDDSKPADANAPGRLGRMLNSKEPYRESLGQQLVEQMFSKQEQQDDGKGGTKTVQVPQLIVPRTHVFMVTYTDTNPTRADGDPMKVRKQPAIMTETAGKASERFFGAGAAVAGEGAMPPGRATVKTDDMLRFLLQNIFTGNRDQDFGWTGDTSQPELEVEGGFHNSKYCYNENQAKAAAAAGQPVEGAAMICDYDLCDTTLQDHDPDYWKNQQEPLNFPVEIGRLAQQFPTNFNRIADEVLGNQAAMLQMAKDAPLDPIDANQPADHIASGRPFFINQINTFCTAVQNAKIQPQAAAPAAQ
jgi:hypothetical protein